MNTQSNGDVDLPKGDYVGTWSGYVVEVRTENTTLNILVKDGMKGTAACDINVNGAGKAIVKTK